MVDSYKHQAKHLARNSFSSEHTVKKLNKPDIKTEKGENII